ncbi:MAG: class I SAM-dependent rRNA methyltransferase [Saprospiraceae bacterium]|nr:class I SAM-dependent rRNA methyltransferase [Saprospiraceae bacterium]
MKNIKIRKNRENSILRQHPWIFSGALVESDIQINEGELVRVVDYRDNFLAIGYYSIGSIAIRILSHKDVEIDQNFWDQAIRSALIFREQIGITADQDLTNCYRLIHAEGDGLPGLIIDIYNMSAVVQCHTVGMHLQIKLIEKALLYVFGKKIDCIFDKSKETLPKEYSSDKTFGFIYGSKDYEIVLENGIKFKIDWVTGQKTGFFLDQRENRDLLKSFVKDKVVLNTFSYTGGFTVYSLCGGAKRVDSVDASAKAIEFLKENIELNGFDANTNGCYVSDTIDYLKSSSEKYDVIILDPPAYAKNLSKRHNAVQGYKRLNAIAMNKIAKGGIIFTFSCSQVIDRQLFYDTILAAALESKRSIRVLYHLSQPPDHPVSIFHNEGAYLKGLVLYVD